MKKYDFIKNYVIITVMMVKNEKNLPLGEIIRSTRKLAELTQIELAHKARVGKTLIFNLEKGSTQVSFNNIQKVLKVLNIKIIFQPSIIQSQIKNQKQV